MNEWWFHSEWSPLHCAQQRPSVVILWCQWRDDVAGIKVACVWVAMWFPLMEGGSISPKGYWRTVSPTVGLIGHQNTLKYGTGCGSQCEPLVPIQSGLGRYGKLGVPWEGSWKWQIPGRNRSCRVALGTRMAVVRNHVCVSDWSRCTPRAGSWE
jgi:hypothetical protein